MPTTYVLKQANDPLAQGQDFSKVLSVGLETEGSIGPFEVTNGTYTESPPTWGTPDKSYAYTPANNPSDDGGSGSQSYTVEVEVLAPGSTVVHFRTFVGRINSSGLLQGSEVQVGPDRVANAGSYINGPTSADLGTFAVGDRLRVRFDFASSNAHGGAATVELGTGQANNEVEAPWVIPPKFSSGSTADGLRDIGAGTTNLSLAFSEAIELGGANYTPGDTVLGLVLHINAGAAQPLKYVQGEGTATWQVQYAGLLHQGQALTLDYVQADGNLVSVATGTELKGETGLSLSNSLTKRIYFVLKKSDDSVVASETVKYSVYSFDSGVPANANWMTREQKGTTTTDASGVMNFAFTGSSAPEATVYVAVVRPNTTPTESMLWTDVVV